MAHRLGVIHRDLKPSNILMGSDDLPKIVDFGLAKDMAEDTDLTRSDVLLGSPSYMSPEQAELGARRAGPASDVYSLGAVFYELLTGRPPFRGTSVLDTLQQVRTIDPVPPSRLVSRVDRDAETVVLKCLDKAPSRRYASAGELADDLRRFLDHRPILGRRVGLAGRVARFCRRNPGIASLVAAVFLLLVLVTGVSLTAAIRIAASAESERRGKYFARMNLAQLAWDAADVRRMRELLKPYGPGESGGDLRGFEWYYWSRLAGRYEAELKGHTRQVNAVAYSPDDKTVVSIGADQSVIVWDAATSGVRRILRSPFSIDSLAISPDGATIAAGATNGSIVTWGPDGNDPWVSPHPSQHPVVAMHFRDERTIVAALDVNLAQIWDLRTRQLVGESRGSSLQEGAIADAHFRPHALSGDGQLLAAADRVGHVIVRPVKPQKSGGDHERIFQIGDQPARSLAFSRNGRVLAVGGEDRLITLFDVDRGVPTLVLRKHSASVWSLAFSPDDMVLVAASLDNTVTLWDVASGRLLTTLKGHGGPIMAVGYSHDGSHVASGSLDKTVKTWKVQGKESELLMDGGRVGIDTVAYARDGKTLITGARDGRISFWLTETGRRLDSIEPRGPVNPHGHPSYVRALALSTDGHILISGGWNGPVRLWDARTHGFLGTLQSEPDDGHSYDSIALSPDGTILAIGQDTGEIFLWAIESRSLRSVLRGGARVSETSSSASTAGLSFLRG